MRSASSFQGMKRTKRILALTLLAWLACLLTVSGQPGTAERISKVELPGYKTASIG